jgi:hypothetical protein
MPSFIEDVMGMFLSKIEKGKKPKKRNPMSNEDMDEFITQRYGDLKNRGERGPETHQNLRKMYQDLWLEEKRKKEQRDLKQRGQHRLNYHKGNRPGIGEYSMPYRTYEPPRHPDQNPNSGFYLQPPKRGSDIPTRRYQGTTITPGIRG